ncbi:MAG: DNA integrity scanning diadenylate cyclase DisA [Actinomycetota bacterium]|nr:DNA integrity scanning diadenylate cyclase DisA [Actinomycetota bacterium]
MPPNVSAPIDLLKRFAPGTGLRDAVELVMNQGSGALVVLGAGPVVDDVCTGGFDLVDLPFTAQRLAELAKMDGGIVVDDALGTITRANVHFIPDPTIATSETGTRFRTAERLARQTGLPVLAVSEEGHLFAVVFSGDARFALQSVTNLLAEANQRLQSIERLRRQFNDAVLTLNRYEADDLVSMRDVVGVIQRAAVIRKLAHGLDTVSAELGDAASLISLQSSDLTGGVHAIAELVNIDYQKRKPRKETSVFTRLDPLGEDDLYAAEVVAEVLNLGPLDEHAKPRGVRAIARVPRLPDTVRGLMMRKFTSYEKLMGASADDLAEVEGVGKARARTILTYLHPVSGLGSIPTAND